MTDKDFEVAREKYLAELDQRIEDFKRSQSRIFDDLYWRVKNFPHGYPTSWYKLLFDSYEENIHSELFDAFQFKSPTV